MQKFKRYYLVWFIVWWLINIIGLVQIENYSKELIVLVLLTAVVAPLACGKLHDWAENVWTPRRRVKLYNRSPLSDLQDMGFVNVNDEYLVAELDNAVVLIIFHGFQQSLDIHCLDKSVGTEEESLYHAEPIASESIEFLLRVPSIKKLKKIIEDTIESAQKSEG